MLYGYDTTEAICAELSEENRKLKAEMEIMLRPFELQVEVSKRIEQKIRAEAIKEFAERLKDMYRHNTTSITSLVTLFDNINNLVKEMEKSE